MYTFHPKMNLSLLCAIFVLFSTSFIGCGDSQGVTTLNAHLSEFSELVENYEASVAEDRSKQAELDARIEAMSVKWTISATSSDRISRLKKWMNW